MISEHREGVQADAEPSEEAAYGKSSLTKATLEAHFEYSLSEAAKRLGVSNTTVKRACRLVFPPSHTLLTVCTFRLRGARIGMSPRANEGEVVAGH